MQPEPSDVFQKIIPEPIHENTSSALQHGLCDDQPASLLPRDGERREPESLSRRVSAINGTPRLNPASPLPRNRIDEYEKALTPGAKKRAERPMFEVIKKDGKFDKNSSPISKLPNEVLTHALSHLSPNDLAAVSLVSRRFNAVVTHPHAWMVAFARYFPGHEVLLNASDRLAMDDTGETIRSERRSFTRLTALASWRSEYILRTRLLRSLVRGKPAMVPSSNNPRSGQVQPAAPVIMYPARTFTTVNHLHATFGSGLNKRVPRFIHGADDVGMVTSSDPANGRVDAWGETDPNFFGQFAERFPGVAEWGLGAGDVVGRPNVMDVSQPHGMIYGQGCPEGLCYFRALEELRGRFIAEPTDFWKPEDGIPKLGVDGSAICSVWIAKSTTIPTLSEGLVGLMMGSASGVLTACSLGTDGLRGQRLQRGELTARWVLSPGVPIISIVVDEHYSVKRQSQGRIWAVALNALGELFYLTKFPTRSQAPRDSMDISEYPEYLAWMTGRTVYWNLVEPSRRAARPDPYQDADIAGTYSPRSSWNGMGLSKDQVVAETREIQEFLRKAPKDFRKSCLGWDMRRRIEVDFAGDDGNYAGEAMVVFNCGLGEDESADIRRFTRWRVPEQGKEMDGRASPLPEPQQQSSLFGNPGNFDKSSEQSNGLDIQGAGRARSSSYNSASGSADETKYVEDWRCSQLTFGGLRSIQITATTLDISTFSVLTLSEDPALGFSTVSTASSPYASPMSVASQPASPSDIPGQRARFVAVGTRTGSILVWDVRSSVPRSSDFTNTLDPVRIIYTESPEISCLALTALQLVHGGNDGLVQAWDVLASSLQPIKTLNSRFSSRARRRLVQAQASAQGVGVNMFAAGALCLDPDPTRLRGAVSIGNQIRYWSYSSSAADQFKSSKRRLRRSERGTNAASDRFSAVNRVNLKGYIENEQYELERDKHERRRQADRLAGRFGVDLLDDEDEALAYAALLSQESLEQEERQRKESEFISTYSSVTATPEPSITDAGDIDADIAEAIRLSLQESPLSSSPGPAFDIPIRYAKGRKSPPVKSNREGNAESSKSDELSDLEFALQLSLAEEQSRKETDEDDFPALSPNPSSGKGKGRM